MLTAVSAAAVGALGSQVLRASTILAYACTAPEELNGEVSGGISHAKRQCSCLASPILGALCAGPQVGVPNLPHVH